MRIGLFIKNGIKRIINGLGYNLVKKSVNNKWVNVTDAVKHNSLEQVNEFYKDEKLLVDYISDERIVFYKEVSQLIMDKIGIVANKTIADIGCGTGHLLYYLNNEFNFQKVVGFEYSPEAIKVAKKLFPAFEFYEFDIYKGTQEQFDLLLSTEVLEHLLNPDKALTILVAMMRDNGKALITVPNGRTDTFGGHINFWSPESWEVFIKTNVQDFKFETGLLQSGEINYAIISKD